MAVKLAAESGSLLRAPSNSADNGTGSNDSEASPPTRLPSAYAPLPTFALPKAKAYQQQYGDMYFLRLALLKPSAEQAGSRAWEGFSIGGEEVRRVQRVLDVRQGELCWVVGTVYMDMVLKPNILEDISKDHWISAPPPREKYLSPNGDDSIMLEDESGRLRLIGPQLGSEMLVTGCIVAVMGTENANGDFEVVDIKVPDLPAQPPRWAVSGPPNPSDGTPKKRRKIESDDEDDTKSSVIPGNGGKIAIVSGLGINGSSTENSLEIDLLVEYLLGEALDPVNQQEVSKISRLIIAGNSLGPENDPITHEVTAQSRKHKKYGYDSSAYNPAPTAHLDAFLAALLPSMPITLIPGAADPANVSLPQQPIHPAMLPHARAYAADPPSASEVEGEGELRQPGWFDSVTNPWEGEVEGWRLLGTGGQNVDDVFKYVEGEDRLGMMEAMCRWRCVAPTAPDTLWSYPFQDDDPFVMHDCPHLFFVGSQAKFDTAVIEGPEGQMVRLITVPKFAETGELVLVDTETLDVSRVQIGIWEDRER